VKQGLTLLPVTIEIASQTILADLRGMPSNRTPSSNLAGIIFRSTA
jgi:hypothetical protein